MASALAGAVVEWQVRLPAKGVKQVVAQAVDAIGNAEQHLHQVILPK